MSEPMTLTVRRAEPGDYPAVARVYAGPQVIWGTLSLPFPSEENWRRRLAEPVDGTYVLVVCAGQEVIGHLGLRTYPQSPRRRHSASLSMAIRDDWQGRGAGTVLLRATLDLADKWLNLTRLELEVFTDNESAVRLYEKFGFVVEGTLVDFAYRDGRFVDAYSMARRRTRLPR